VGNVTKTQWDGRQLLYEAEVYDEDTAQRIRKGLIQHVNVGADYDPVLAGAIYIDGTNTVYVDCVVVADSPSESKVA
jgi:hypothetical protein